MPLTDTKVKSAKAQEKQYKLTDEKGLFLLVHKNGSKYWRLKYRFDGKEKLLALGVYPETSLKEARDKRDEAKKQIREGSFFSTASNNKALFGHAGPFAIKVENASFSQEPLITVAVFRPLEPQTKDMAMVTPNITLKTIEDSQGNNVLDVSGESEPFDGDPFFVEAPSDMLVVGAQDFKIADNLNIKDIGIATLV